MSRKPCCKIVNKDNPTLFHVCVFKFIAISNFKIKGLFFCSGPPVLPVRYKPVPPDPSDYELRFPGTTSDYVIKRGVKNLKAVTFCVWMKSSEGGNGGALFSYAVPGSDNELVLDRHGNIVLWVGGGFRYKYFLSYYNNNIHLHCTIS